MEEVQLRKYGKFLEGYCNQLKDVEHALDENLDDVWKYQLDPISLMVNFTLFTLISLQI